MFWLSLDVRYKKIYPDTAEIYQCYFIFGMGIAPREKMCYI